MKKEFAVIRRKDAKLGYDSGTDTGSALHRVIDETNTDEMGGGYFSVNGIENKLVLPYDELAICIEGKLKLTVDGVLHVLEPGDFAWMPKGTDVTFGGENAVAFYGVHPVDWRVKSA